MAGPQRGTVTLGFLRTLGIRFVPELVRSFSASNEQVRFSFLQSSNIALEEQLLNGDLDLVLNTRPLTNPVIEWRQVAEEELILIVPPNDPLVRKRRVALSEVADRPFVAFKDGHFRQTTDALCRAAGFEPTIRFEADDSSSVPGFVAAGFGVAIMSPDSALATGVASLRITEPAARRTIGVAWSKDRYLSASARSFRDFAIAHGASFLRPANLKAERSSGAK
jgi:DNA-binding transcriptional LysR family regulator